MEISPSSSLLTWWSKKTWISIVWKWQSPTHWFIRVPCWVERYKQRKKPSWREWVKALPNEDDLLRVQSRSHGSGWVTTVGTSSGTFWRERPCLSGCLYQLCVADTDVSCCIHFSLSENFIEPSQQLKWTIAATAEYFRHSAHLKETNNQNCQNTHGRSLFDVTKGKYNFLTPFSQWSDNRAFLDHYSCNSSKTASK